LSSPDDRPEDQEEGSPAPSADEVTDPALKAEIANPAESNVPTGADAGPGGDTAADRADLPAPGAPGELHSDQTPAQGDGPEREGDDGGAEAAPAAGEVDDATGRQGVQGDDAVIETGADGGAARPSPVADGGPTAAAPDQPEGADAAEEGLPVEAAAAPDDAAAEATPVTPEERADEDAAEPEPEPTDEARQAMVDVLRAALGEGVVETHVRPGTDVWVRVRADHWRRAAEVCRAELGLTYFCFLSAVDWLPSPFGKSEDGEPRTAEDVRSALAQAGRLDHGLAGGETRFQLLARVYSVARKLGLTLKADVPDDDLVADTWTGVYPGANWHERETWEMFGIEFRGHPYLVKLYLPGSFEGFPLRKDFPLLAREVKPWPGLVDVEAMPGEPVDPADDPLAAIEAEG
jgi:NADH-quinone oxidoreductase subunit C